MCIKFVLSISLVPIYQQVLDKYDHHDYDKTKSVTPTNKEELYHT